MITVEDVYVAYRRAKSLQSGKGFRLPKDWDEFYATKMTPKNKELLEKAAGYFNTTWSNININEYMECGAEMYKSFAYHMFFHPKVLQNYIEKDKRKKRRIGKSAKSIEDTFVFINHFMRDRENINGYNMLQSYCKITDGHKKTILEHYMKNRVDPLVVVYCLYYKYLRLTDIERQYVYSISNRYRDLLQDMFDVEQEIKDRELDG